VIVLVARRNYKCCWDGGLIHVLLVNGGLLRIREVEG